MAVAWGCQASNQDIEGCMPLSSHSYSCPRSPSPHPIYSLIVEPTCSRHSLSVLLHASCGRSSHGHCVRSRQQRALVLGWIGVSQAVTNGVGRLLLPARPSRAILPAGARPGWHVRPNGMTPQPVNLTASATTANHVQPLNAISTPGLTITKASLVAMPTISSLAPLPHPLTNVALASNSDSSGSNSSSKIGFSFYVGEVTLAIELARE